MNEPQSRSPRPSPPPRPPPPLFNINNQSPSPLNSNQTPPPLPSRPSLQLNHPLNSNSIQVNCNQNTNSFFTPTPSRRTLTTSSFFNSATRRVGSLGKGGIGVPSFLRTIIGNNSNNSSQQQQMAATVTVPPTDVTGQQQRLELGLNNRVRGSVDNGNVQLERPGLNLGTNLNNHRPSQLVSAQCLSPRPRPRVFPGFMEIPAPRVNPISPKDLSDRFGANNIINIDGKQYPISQEDLIEVEELGAGASGQVFKRRHLATGKMLAVKQMRISKDELEIKRIAMDLETLLKCSSSEHIVKCYGYIIRDTEVWICMELMASCFEKLLKNLKQPFPEDIIGKVAVATLKALNYLKDNHKVMHRDIKPSNILVNEAGLIKLCDFGISGNLIDSKAKTRGAGCTAYLAPERIDSGLPHYDVRADVWSFGITLVELAKGNFPYTGCECDFEVLTKIVKEDAPSLDPEKDGFSPEFCDFTKQCLIKDYKKRPKYKKLLEHPFILKYEEKDVNVAEWFKNVNQKIITSNSDEPLNRLRIN